MPRICLIPNVHGVGGLVSFQAKLAASLESRGIEICRDLAEAYDAVLVTGGTRDLPGLWRARRRGVRVVQRLDGINWVHRQRRGNLRHFLRAEYGNRILALIRQQFATHIVYQSAFVRDWWQDWFGAARRPSVVIHNGVDLNVYTPDGPQARPADRFRMLVVEGSLAGSLTTGLDLAVELAEQLSGLARLPLDLRVVGKVDAHRQAGTQQRSPVPLEFTGVVPRERIPELDRSAHLLFSAEINAPCPNSVIEAMACGLPVAAFQTGALPELVTGDAGRLVPYGGDPWKLERPDIPALASAAAEILADPQRFRRAARQRAEESFGLDRMVERYLDVLLG
ncbi:MAG: putative glycosyltransferase [Anaerolineaceae bacterium]|nr:MAG: putative glycosyltransferase [Anaerolineaceae bacterium]